MSLLKRLFRPRPNGIHEIELLREERDRSLERLSQSAKRVARAVETISKHKKENELASLMARFRIHEGHD